VTLPPELRAAVGSALESAGHDAAVLDERRLGGGCISPAARISTADGARFFIKWSAAPPPPRFFAEEAASLRALAAADAVRVPAVTAVAEQWLLLEWLEPGAGSSTGWRSLGRDLARLHRTTSTRFGWDSDNYIGTLPQSNASSPSWPRFWRERRLRPQLHRALAARQLTADDERGFEKLFARLDELLAQGDSDRPSLLHGDLWGGNVHLMGDGRPALVDPSASYGHREVDLAMAQLFGGFDDAFFRGYEEEWPTSPGYQRTRLHIYQLYYLLVHVNLFGGAYAQQTRAALARALA
jgi:protein-ribulosamine 3-kinase